MVSAEGDKREQSRGSQEKLSIGAASEPYPASVLRMVKLKADVPYGSLL